MPVGPAAARRVSIGLAGFGNVGRAFARMLAEKRGELAERYGFEPVIVFIADSRGVLMPRGGVDWSLLGEALNAPRGGVSGLEGGRPGATVEEALEERCIDVLVDTTPSRYESPETAAGWYRRVLGGGGVVVTADKAPLATGCSSLLQGSWGRRLYYKATVMAGTPLLDMLRWGMAGRRVERVTGILNGTTNYMLGLAEQGLGFEEALRRAQEEGYAEPDPSSDLEGLDLAAKAAIVSCTLGRPLTVWDVERRGRVDGEAFRAAREALERGERLKYVAVVEPPAGRAFVDLVAVPRDSPLYRVDGAMNAALVEPAEAAPVTVMGPGAGREATAASLVSDLVEAVLMGVL